MRYVLGGGAAACAVCCAPPVLALVGIAGAGTVATVATLALAGLVFALVVAAASLVAFVLRKRRRDREFDLQVPLPPPASRLLHAGVSRTRILRSGVRTAPHRQERDPGSGHERGPTGVVPDFRPFLMLRDRLRLAPGEVREAAMRYEVNEHESEVEIHVSDAAGHTSELLRSMHACQTGSCGCPTDQYDKLAAMEVDEGADEVTVRLQPLPGEHLDAEQVKACLDYTITQAGG